MELYLHINKHIYDNDEKRIVFTLSFMTDGAATTWKEAYIADKTIPTGGFALIDKAGNACLKLKTLKQGEWTAKDYILDFHIYISKSAITADEALSKYFMDGL